MNKPTLISISNELLSLTRQREEILVSSEGEISEKNETILNQLELQIRGTLTQSKEKISSYCGFLDSLEVEAAFCEQKIKEVQAYIKRLRSTQDWLLGTAKLVIESSGQPLEGQFGNKIFLRKSSSVEVTCKPEDLPEGLKRIKMTVEPDKKAIKEKLESGASIEGCRIVESKNPSWK